MQKKIFIYSLTKSFRNLIYPGSFSGTMHKFLTSGPGKGYGFQPWRLSGLLSKRCVFWGGIPRSGNRFDKTLNDHF